MKIVLPDEIQGEENRLAKAFFDQYNDDDEIPDGAMDAYFEAYASEEYKAFMSDLDEYRKNFK